MKLTKQQARNIDDKALKKFHKDMLRVGKKNKLFAELNNRYPTRRIFGMSIPEYVRMLEEEIQQENKNK